MNKLVIELSGPISTAWIAEGVEKFKIHSNRFQVIWAGFGCRGSYTGIAKGVPLQGDNVANLYSKGDRAKLLNVHSWPRLLCPSHPHVPLPSSRYHLEPLPLPFFFHIDATLSPDFSIFSLDVARFTDARASPVNHLAVNFSYRSFTPLLNRETNPR